MSISAVGNAATHALQIRPQVPTSAPKGKVPVVGRDSDGDNDGSKGGTVDVRA